MRVILLSLLSALSATLVDTKSSIHKRDVCDVQNNAAANDACGMKKAFAGSSLVPQLLPSFEPSGALYVRYANLVVGGAQQLAPNRVASKPALSTAFLQGPMSITGAHMLSKKYSVLCVDFQPKGKLVQAIWLQTDLNVDPHTGAMFSSISPLIPYKSPNPPRGTGTHEYVFLLLSESGAGLRQLLNGHPQLRAQLNRPFNLKVFLDQSNLRNSIVAGSFFKSTHV